ncbi:MAG: hypothetical protein E6J52_00975 [Chloroflexi bacterium]|nr:MAG: hypothetical protein E6J52_00975 [Chloroflexota bacterium]
MANDAQNSSAPYVGIGQWALRRMQVDRAWDVARGSPQIVVAIVDTGVDRGHPDLAGALLPGATFLSRVSSACTYDDEDDNSHGTHIAGIIGAAPNPVAGSGGVAFGVRILPIKVLDCAGTGSNSDIAAGIVWATDHGARIVNVSLGSPVESDALATAVRYAVAKDVLVVAAAGNCGEGGGRCRFVNSKEFPAALPGALAVGATDADDQVTSFSTRGAQIAIVAPGVRITSTTPRYATYQSARGVTPNYAALSGTSQASAFVAGIAALMLSADPRLSASDVADRIAAYADDLGDPGRDDASGAGRVNALRALNHPTPISSARAQTADLSAIARDIGIASIDASGRRITAADARIELVEDVATLR